MEILKQSKIYNVTNQIVVSHFAVEVAFAACDLITPIRTIELGTALPAHTYHCSPISSECPLVIPHTVIS